MATWIGTKDQQPFGYSGYPMFAFTNFVQSLHLPLPAMSNPTSARTSATFSESVMASEAQIISNTSLDQPTPKRLVEYDCSNNDAPATSRQAALAPSETRIHPFRTEPWPWMWWVLRWYLPWLHPGPLDAPMKTHMESKKCNFQGGKSSVIWSPFFRCSML